MVGLHRPIIIQRYGGFEVWNIKKLTTLEAVVRYHIWEQERACALLAKQVGRQADQPAHSLFDCRLTDSLTHSRLKLGLMPSPRMGTIAVHGRPEGPSE